MVAIYFQMNSWLCKLIHELIHHIWISIRLINLIAEHKTNWTKKPRLASSWRHGGLRVIKVEHFFCFRSTVGAPIPNTSGFQMIEPVRFMVPTIQKKNFKMAALAKVILLNTVKIFYCLKILQGSEPVINEWMNELMNEKFILFSHTTIINENMNGLQFINIGIFLCKFFNMRLETYLVSSDLIYWLDCDVLLSM